MTPTRGRAATFSNSMIATEPTITLAEIDTLAKEYSAARGIVADRVAELDADIQALQRRRIGGIKTAAATAADAKAKLVAAIDRAPELFKRPKTFTLHGITCGYRKGSGKVDWDDDAKVVELIRKYLPEQADVLIIKVEKPAADAMKNLDARDLAKIGARVEGTGDVVVVRTTDSAVDKLVAKILKEGAQDAGTED